MISNKKRILLLLTESKNTMLTITAIARQLNLEKSVIKQELIELKELKFIRSNCQAIEIKNCWFNITLAGENAISKI